MLKQEFLVEMSILQHLYNMQKYIDNMNSHVIK